MNTASSTAAPSSHHSGLAVTVSLPRRQAECMPMARNTMSGSTGTRNMTANTGGPTEILPMPSSSYASGESVPHSTSPATLTRITLFTSKKNSRENSWNPPGAYSFGARHAYRLSEPPMVITRNARIYSPRVGSLAKECTDTSTPERTRKVPTRLKENAKIASSRVQLLKIPRFSVTLKEWISAVPTSHGMNEAFSTGSQNHQPPQPNS